MFDRYFEDSVKYHTRCERSSDVTRRYTLSNNIELPPEKQVLPLTDNKKQLSQLIVEDLKTNFIIGQSNHNLVVTGIDPNLPPFVAHNNMTLLNDLINTQEEADMIIIIQVLLMNIIESSGESPIVVVCDDTDVFTLLYFYKVKSIMANAYMQATSKERRLISIPEKRVTKLEVKGYSIEDMLPLHA